MKRKSRADKAAGILLFCAVLCAMMPSFADGLSDGGPSFKLGGQYKNLFTCESDDGHVGSAYDTPHHKNMIADLSRLRLSPEFTYGEALFVHADYDSEFITGNYLRSPVFDALWRTPHYNDLAPLSWEPYYRGGVYCRTKIHRAFAKLSLGSVSVTAGRQQIRFGSGKLWNPLDVFNPVSPTALEGAEEQKGTDAARGDIYLGESTVLTLAVAPKRGDNRIGNVTPRSSDSAVRFKTTAGRTDLAFLGGYLGRQIAGGIDCTSTVADGSLRGSVVCFRPDASRSYVLANAGYEYTFLCGLDLIGEYFFNSNALNGNARLRQIYERSFFTGLGRDNYAALSNRFITYNRHYVGIFLGYDIFPLLRAELFTIGDVEGRGVFVSPSLKYSTTENVSVTAGLMAMKVWKRTSSDFDSLRNSPLLFASLSVYF